MRQEVSHDFKPAIEKTSVELARVVLENYLENFQFFVYEDSEETQSPEFVANIEEKTIDFAIRTMALMAATDIPADYATYGIDKIIAGLNALKVFIDGSVRQNIDELLARTIGAKSPVTNTYAKDVATFGQLMMALKNARDLTGNNPDDYFVKKASPEEIAAAQAPAELSPAEDVVPKSE